MKKKNGLYGLFFILIIFPLCIYALQAGASGQRNILSIKTDMPAPEIGMKGPSKEFP